MTRSTCVSVPLVSVDGTAPEAERVDPERCTPPTRKSRSPRLDTGPVRAAIGRVRRPERVAGLRASRWRLIPLTQVTATVGLAADLKAAEDESNPWPPKMADHAFGFLCWSPTGQEVEKSGKE